MEYLLINKGQINQMIELCFLNGCLYMRPKKLRFDKIVCDVHDVFLNMEFYNVK